MNHTTAVVILNWNGAKLLAEFLPKVVENTLGGDVIVADNCSTDDSVQFLRENFPSVKLVLLDRNYGFAGGYNRALAQLDYTFFVLLNSDAAPAKGWLLPLIACLEQDDQVAVSVPKLLDYRHPDKFEYAGGAGGFIDYLGYPFCRGRLFDAVEADLGQYNDQRAVFWATGASLAIKAKIYLELGGLDEDFFAHQEEIDLCWRINNRGYKIIYVPESSVFHLGGATLNSSNPHKTYLNFRNNLFMILKNHSRRALVRTLLLRMILDGVVALKYALSADFGNFMAIIKAHLHFYGGLGRFYKKRKEVLHAACENHFLIYPKSVVWQYFVKGVKKYSDL